MYATKREIAETIAQQTKQKVGPSDITILAFYAYRNPPDLDHAGQRIEWILAKEKLRSGIWYLLRKIDLFPVTLEFTKGDKSEAVFHWQANLKHL